MYIGPQESVVMFAREDNICGHILPFHIRSNDLPENWNNVERVQILDTNNWF